MTICWNSLVFFCTNSHHMKQLRWCETTTPRSWSVAHQASAANNLAIFFTMPWRWGKIHRNRDRNWAPFSWGWNELQMTNIHGIWNHNGIRWIYNQDNLDFLKWIKLLQRKMDVFWNCLNHATWFYSANHKKGQEHIKIGRRRWPWWRPSRVHPAFGSAVRISNGIEKGCCTYTDRS